MRHTTRASRRGRSSIITNLGIYKVHGARYICSRPMARGPTSTAHRQWPISGLMGLSIRGDLVESVPAELSQTQIPGTTESRRRLLFLHHHEIDNNRASSSSSPGSAPVLGFRLFSHPPVEGKNRGGKTRPDQPRSDIGDMFLKFCIRTTCIINLPPSRPRQQRLQAWQPDVSSALGTQQPGSGVSHNLACPAAHYLLDHNPSTMSLSWVCLGRASGIGLVSSTFYIKIAHCLVPASFRHPWSLPDQLTMQPTEPLRPQGASINPRGHERSSDRPAAIGWRGIERNNRVGGGARLRQ